MKNDSSELRLYNTLTRQKEQFEALNPPEVRLYVCGPTVYDFAHIGNLRTYVFSDLLRRTLEFFSFKVTEVMNITDVGHLTSDSDSGEDKLEKGAKREGKTVWEIAEFYTQAFKNDLQALNIKEPKVWARATDCIKEQLALVVELVRLGFAYKIEDGIYFDTSKLSDYGKLAKLDIEGLKKGARISFNLQKRNPTDFALWKFADESENRQMEWPSPWSDHSYPGWHVECSAMAMKHLSESFDRKGNFYPERFEPIDIHTGGVDHIPVHHTNEIAQSESVTGKPFARYWLHGEHLLINEGRMGKSEGNFITLNDLVEKGFDPLAYRYFLLNAHYRTQLNFSFGALESSQIALRNLRREISLIGQKPDRADEGYLNQFREAIGDDLNLPRGLAILWQLLKSDLKDSSKRATINQMDKVLGLSLSQIAPILVPEKVSDLINKRQEARENRDFERSDQIREKIEKLGFEIEDTPSGPRPIPKEM